MFDQSKIGETIHGWAKDLFPICRSISGNGVRETLDYLQEKFPLLSTFEVETGTKAFDWKVPDEWNIRAAWIENEDGERVIDFANCNLHVVGYSEPIDIWLDLDELQLRLYSLPDQPDAIPYVSSVYNRTWGFCIADTERKALKPGKYRCFIDSTLGPGSLTFAEAIIPGESEREILISTYADHPSMANNELSGPLVATAIGQWLLSLPERHFTYRILIAPETIGAVVNLSMRWQHFKAKLEAGFVLSCLGDDRCTSVLHSPYGDTLADRVSTHVLRHTRGDTQHYTFLDRGSDERQFCSPGLRLPVVTLCRTLFAKYPEYHTSLDDLENVVTPAGLQGGFDYVRRCIEVLEANRIYRTTVKCEPQLAPRGLYPKTMHMTSGLAARSLTNLIAYLDGEEDLLAVCERIEQPVWQSTEALQKLIEHGLVERID